MKTLFLTTIYFLIFSSNMLLSQHEAYPFEQNGLWGIVDGKGNVLLEPTFLKLSYFSGGGSELPISIAEGEDGMESVVDKDGRLISGFFWHEDYHPGFIISDENNKMGAVDYKGNFILPCEYDQIVSEVYSDSYYYFLLKKGDLWGVVDNGEKKGLVIDFISVEEPWHVSLFLPRAI